MPYKVAKGHGCPDGKWAVINSETEEKKGCHDSEESAQSQVRALYANVPDGKKEVEDGKVEKDCYGEVWRPYLGVTSFKELDDYLQSQDEIRNIEALNQRFSAIAENIMADSEIEDKGMALSTLVSEYSERVRSDPPLSASKGVVQTVKDALFGEEDKSAIKRENGIDFPPRDYAYAPDPAKPASWRIRLTESPGKVTLSQLTRAAILLRSPEKAGVPAPALNAIRRRVRAEFRKLGVQDSKLPPSVRENARVIPNTRKDSPFTVWKEANGAYHWMAVYSNKYRDDDYPPEIISEKSHKAFTYLANSGVIPMPELWHWHVKGTRWGVATRLDYVDGFAIAIGTVDKGHEKEAEEVALRGDLGVSHGMYTKHLLRSADDDSVIDFHISHEISDLPLRKAANKLTDFVILSKEQINMPMSKDTRSYLAEVGITQEQIDAIENNLSENAKAAEEAGIESKEEALVEPVVEEVEIVAEAEEHISSAELAEVLTDLITPISKAIGDISQRIGDLEAQVKELSVSDSEKIAKTASMTPRASLRELVAQSIIGNKEAAIDGRTAEARGPKETQPNADSTTLSPFLDSIIGESKKS